MLGFWAVLAIVIVAIIAMGMTTSSSGSRGTQITESGGDNMQVYLDETLSMDGVEDIELEMSAARTTLRHAENNEFRVVQKGENIPDEFVLTVDKSGGTIKLRTKGKGLRIGFFSMFLDPLPKESYVDIYIPAGYDKDLDMRLSAGDLEIAGDYALDDLEIHVSAGGLYSSSSISAKEADLSVSAGDLDLDILKAGNFKFSTSAGSLTIGELTGSGKINASAGEINLKKVAIADRLEIGASAGSIRVGLAGDPSLDFTAKTTAGSVTTYFGADSSGVGSSISRKIGDGPYKTLSVSTSAGSVEIVKAD